MITANEARANVRKMVEERDSALTKVATEWLETSVSYKIMAASKRGELSLVEAVRVSNCPSENEAIAKRAIKLLTNGMYGFKAERTDTMEAEIKISWGDTAE